MARSDSLKRIKSRIKPNLDKNNTNIENENKNKKEAKDLVANLNVVFYSLPMVDPSKQRIKLPEKYIQIINEVLNTENELILKSEYYNDVKNILIKILEYNNEGILIDDEFLAMSRKIQVFYYSFQDKEYWEEKPF